MWNPPLFAHHHSYAVCKKIGLSCSTFETVGPRGSAPERMVFNENLQSCLSTTRKSLNLLDDFFWTELIQRLQRCSPSRKIAKKSQANWHLTNSYHSTEMGSGNGRPTCGRFFKRVGWKALQWKVFPPKWYHHQGQVSSWWHGYVFISALVHHWFIIGSSCFIIASSCSVIASSCSVIALLCFVVVLSCYIIDSSLSHHVLLFLIPIGERIWLACSCFSKPGSPCKSAFFFPLKNPGFFVQ